MVKPRATVLPRDILLNTLWAIKELDGKELVTEITTCPAFALYLSDQSMSYHPILYFSPEEFRSLSMGLKY